MKYFPHTADDLREMLRVVGVGSLDDLYAEVPEELKFGRELNLPPAMSEIEVRKVITSLAGKNKQLTSFAGAGVYDHYTPAVVPYIASRSEFSTSYTPYQAEISQGTLQYIFEYQSMMADLTGMDISNASMYDGATATAEAMMMCVAAAKKRNRVLISETLQPRRNARCGDIRQVPRRGSRNGYCPRRRHRHAGLAGTSRGRRCGRRPGSAAQLLRHHRRFFRPCRALPQPQEPSPSTPWPRPWAY